MIAVTVFSTVSGSRTSLSAFDWTKERPLGCHGDMMTVVDRVGTHTVGG